MTMQGWWSGSPEGPVRVREAVPVDADWVADLRAEVMRADLTRLGRYDEQQVRQRLKDSFVSGNTMIVLLDGKSVGCLALRPGDDEVWLEHFYLEPAVQGRGIGGGLLRLVTARADVLRQRLALEVLIGSPAHRLYARHGFTATSEHGVDIVMTRVPR